MKIPQFLARDECKKPVSRLDGGGVEPFSFVYRRTIHRTGTILYWFPFPKAAAQRRGICAGALHGPRIRGRNVSIADSDTGPRSDAGNDGTPVFVRVQ